MHFAASLVLILATTLNLHNSQPLQSSHINGFRDDKNNILTTTIKPKSHSQTLSRGLSQDKYIYLQEYVVTYYSSDSSENGGYKGITCTGDKLVEGHAANNKLPLGTKIYLAGIGEVVVADTGGREFNNPNRLDIFVPRIDGESRRQYLKRVKDMGRKVVKGYIIIN